MQLGGGRTGEPRRWCKHEHALCNASKNNNPRLEGSRVVLSIFGGSKGKNSVTKVMCDAFGKERAVLVYYLAALSENCSSLRSDLWRSLGGFVGF